MELHHRVELVDTLLEEGAQKMDALHHALAAKERSKEKSQQAGHAISSTHEDETLKYEQALWEKACTGLTEVRTVLEEIEESERQRGLSQ
jgi:hypothetical protein